MDFELPAKAEEMDALELLKYASSLGDSCVFASSFGPEDMVILDMLHLLGSGMRVITIDTGRLPEETYELIEDSRRKYGMRIEILFPDYKDVEEMVRTHGINLFRTSVEMRKLCCRVRKVLPLNRMLEGMGAWVTGLRREQADTRQFVSKCARDPQRNLIKICPLADWTEGMVWNYVREHAVPVSSLHSMGYRSIGCEPCTRAVAPWEDQRAGRWYWEDGQKECGLHVSH
ncbi:MAG: phosphoadenylyl-sulfate reductase [Methanomassiliicoccales archaeon]